MGAKRDEREKRKKRERKQRKAEAAEAKELAKRARKADAGDGRSRARAAGGAVARTLLADPEVLRKAVGLGLVRQEWADDPEGQPLADRSASDLVERVLERRVQQHPSTLAVLGLTAIQLLASGSDDDGTGSAEELTVVFSDLEGFTSFTAQQGDQAAGRLLAEHQQVVSRVVRSRGGRLVKHLGDGVLLTFPSPEAAVLAALELVDEPPEPLRLRVGMHCDEVLVTGHQDLVGHVVNVAARVTDLGGGGEVLVTAAVCEQATGLDDVTFVHRGPTTLKGIDEPVPVFLVQR